MTLDDKVWDRVLALLPQIEDPVDRCEAVVGHINSLSNWELIKLITDAMRDENQNG